MVSSLSIVFMVISLLISVGLPIGLVIYFYRKQKISIKAVLIGALMFFIFQGVLRIPIMSLVQSQSWYSKFAMENMILTIIIIGFTAALFETAGRYIGLRFLLKNKLERKNGIAYGIGHGGIEAILLVGTAYVANLVYSIMINTGSLSGTLIPQLISTPSDMFLAAGVERLFTIIFHIAMALLVTYGIMQKKKIYILYSLLLHTLVDSVIIILQVSGVSMWGIEACVALVGLLSLAFIIKSKNLFSLPSVGNNDGGIKNENI